MAIHLRDPRTPVIQYKTLCGYLVAQMHITEKFSHKTKLINCEYCLHLLPSIDPKLVSAQEQYGKG